MIYPKSLKKGMNIAFVAPSFGASVEPYKSLLPEAVRKFENIGYNIELGPNAFEGCGFGISNTPYLCGRELEEYYCSDKNDALISVGGGELMCETIDNVDFEKIKNAAPKWFMGYSDNTHFGFLLTTLCDVASIYGYHAPEFGMNPWHKSCGDMIDALEGKRKFSNYDAWELEQDKGPENPFATLNCTMPYEQINYMGNIRTGELSFEGRLLGGCFDVISNLCGTKYDKVLNFTEKYKNDGIIWFIDICDLGPMDVRRNLWKLKNAGWFEHAKGFIVGRPMRYYDTSFEMSQYDAVISSLGEYALPIVLGADLGHLPPSMPYINGGYGIINADNKLSIEYIDR